MKGLIFGKHPFSRRFAPSIFACDRWLGLRVGSGIVLSLRRALYDHFQKMPLAFFARAQNGLVQSRLNYDVNSVEGLMTETLSSAVTDVVSLTATVVAMFALSWQVALAVLLLVPVILVPTELVGRRMRTLTKERMKHWGDLNIAVTERLNVAGALLVKLFGSLETELENFTDRAHRLRKTAVSQDVLAISFGAGLSLAGSMAVVAIYWLGGLAVLTGGLTLGPLIALATLAQRVYVPVVDLASVRINLTSGLVGFERVFEVLDKPLPIVDRPEARPLAEVQGHVRFDRVWFRYPAPADISIATLESRDEIRLLSKGALRLGAQGPLVRGRAGDDDGARGTDGRRQDDDLSSRAAPLRG